MKSLLRIAALVAVLTASIHAQNLYSSLTIQHPQNPGKWGMGTIESATVAMTPNGTFMKYDLTIRFSAASLSVFAPADSVEVTYQFGLPTESVVNDLWLWVGNELSRGLILNRASASATYENIVKRRRDPALLQKTSPNRYKLQIYPMSAAGTRTVKFSFIAPLKQTGGRWSASVPGYLFGQSLVALNSLRVIYYSPSTGHIPSVMNDTRFAFTPWTDSLAHGTAWKCDIPNAAFKMSDPVIAVPITPADDYMMTRFADTSGGGTYHVLLDPFKTLGINTSRKFLVAFDYDSLTTATPRSTYIQAVQTMLKTECTPKDSFNVIFNDWQRSGEHWFAADSAGIAGAFRTLGAQSIPNGSNIPGLFMNAIEFLNTHEGGQSILLLAASDKLYDPATADPVIDWLRAKLPAGVTVHVADFLDRTDKHYYGPNFFDYGNSYFYRALKTLTGGSTYWLYPNESTAPVFATFMKTMRGGLTQLDLQIRFENGFAYSKYTNGIVPFQTVFTGQLVSQIGKFVGSGPVTLELSGFYGGRPYQRRAAVPDTSILPADSSMRAIWVGKYISDLEWAYTTSQDVVNMIVDECIKERVVCRYTALLALEPGDTLIIAKNELPVVVTTAPAVSNAPAAYQIAQAYPNPFNPSTTLRVRLPQGVRAQEVTLKIYNTLGQLVRTFDPTGMTSASHREFRWDGTDDAGRRVASGMYLFVVATPEGRHTVKLMLLK